MHPRLDFLHFPRRKSADWPLFPKVKPWGLVCGLQEVCGFTCGDFDAEKPNSLARGCCFLYFGCISLCLPVFAAYFVLRP